MNLIVKKTIFLILISIVTVIPCQNTICGMWQFGSPLLFSGESCYHFENDSVFMFCPNEYNDLSIPIIIRGRYLIRDEKIYFKVYTMSYQPLKKIIRRNWMDSSGHNSELYWCSDSTAKRRKKPSSSNYWSIEIDKEKTIPIKNPSTWSAVYKRYKEQEYDVIEIDGDKYYYIPPPEDFGEQEE